MSKFTVAIVGAGLSGLLFAISLQKYAPDVVFEIYEGASELSEIGAGITIHRRTWAMMEALGLDQSLLKLAGTGDQSAVSLVFRKSDQIEGVAYSTVQLREATYTFHRGEIQKVFLAHLQSGLGLQACHLGKRFVSYSQLEGGAGKIELHFQDGTTAACDVLVGADGIRSAVRGTMYEQFAEAALTAGKYTEAVELKSHIPAVFSGCSIFRTMIHKDAAPEEVIQHPAFNKASMMLYCGKNKHFVTYPISQGHKFSVAAVFDNPEGEGSICQDPWSSIVGKEEVVGHFSGWEPAVQEVLEHVNGFNKWAINVVTKLPTYVHGQTVLLGDAAHAMVPFLGAGAGQCFEVRGDAFLLAQFLGRTDVNIETVETALQVYDETRRPYSQHIAALSRRSGQLHHFTTPEFATLTEEQSATGKALTLEQLQEVAKEMGQLNRWRAASFTDENAASHLKLDDALSRS